MTYAGINERLHVADPTLFAPLPVFPSITTPRMGPPGKRLGRKEKGERRKEISRSLPMQVIAAARLLRLRFGYGVISLVRAGPDQIKQTSLQCPRSHKETSTANIPSPHSLEAILSPSAPSGSEPIGVSRTSSPKRSHAEAFSPSEQPYLHPTSPQQHRNSIASAGQSSPGALHNSGGRPDEGSGGGGGQDEKKPAKMVRSSIACARCRRSKVKCVNNGTNSTCKACAASSRECTYPPAATASTPKRPEAPGNIKIEGEIESKKRIRKVEEPGRRNSQRTGDDPLESPILTKKVWDEVYGIFKQHFSTEMPFLHPPAFRLLMRQAAMPRDSASQPSANWQEDKILLLAVLTLTARFHSELVSYHSPPVPNNHNKSEPLVASNYYAAALANAICGPSGRDLTNPSLERIQALLMLGLYEWSQTKGMSAWVYVGMALRLAQAMGLPFEDESSKDSMPIGVSLMPGAYRKAPLKPTNDREGAIAKEIRRRTFWSCFIMDRMLSSGRSRPSMVESDKIRVQLPCTDEQFLFNTPVQTGFLKPDLQNLASSEPISFDDNGALGRYCRLVEIWNNVSQWSYNGGRRTEKLPPWDESSSFYKLDHQLEDFYKALPANLTATDGKLSAHLEQYGASTYASLHVLYLLCCITLHREYIPFIPLRLPKPLGPVDEPVFPKERYNIPPNFWEESAEKLFKSAREIVDIVTTCQDHNALPESPLFIFAVWQAAFVNIYAKHFDQMDAGKHMQLDPTYFPGFLKTLSARSTMAKGYISKLAYMHKFYSEAKAEYEKFNQPINWTGGGLDRYKGFERELKEFGSLENYDLQSDGSDALDQNHSRASTVAPGAPPNGDVMQGVEPVARPTGNWAPINASNASSVEMDGRSKHVSQGPYSHNGSYQQSSNTPSLVSPSNGDSASNLSSPYANGQLPKYGSPLQRQSQYPPAPLPQQVMPPPPASTWSPNERSEASFGHWIGQVEISHDFQNFDDFQQAGFSNFNVPGALLAAAEVYSDQGVNRWN